MKIVTGKRVGQSGPELYSAVLFSFVLHVLVFTAAFILFGWSAPRAFVPPVYRVTLVGQAPGAVPEIPPSPVSPAPAPPQPQKQAKVAPREKAPMKKGGMPELTKKKAAPEREYVAEDTAEAPAKPAGKMQGGVALSGPQEIKFSPYMEIVREKVERNWNPPPGAKETKATVAFRVSRSGRVTGANLQDPSGNFYFDQAAMRAILSSSPFPPLPEGYFRDAMDFSVDLMAKE
jgi:TonB family protein